MDDGSGMMVGLWMMVVVVVVEGWMVGEWLVVVR